MYFSFVEGTPLGKFYCFRYFRTNRVPPDGCCDAEPDGRTQLTDKSEEAASSVPSCLDQSLNNSLSVTPSRDASESRTATS
ncbi:MAG: hypothetical protein VB858_16745, partial [Planctomycetaceae bacterium]